MIVSALPHLVLHHGHRLGGSGRPLVVGVCLATLLLMAGSISISLARFTASDTITGAFTTDALSPPTGLGAAGGTTVTLTWTATPKTWAAGYTIWRATSSGGTYSQIGSVTPRTTVTYVDSPSAGTYYYKVRASYQSWSSSFAGPVSATAGSPSTSTGYKACAGASNAPDIVGAGDNNGYQTTPANGCALDGNLAVDPNSGTGGTQSCGVGTTPDTNKDRHRWWGFAFGLPGSVTSIDGIQVQATAKINNAAGTTNLCAQLSWDGGTTWTAIKANDMAGGSTLTTYTFGTASDTWGHAPWTSTQLNTTNFRVRLIDASTQGTKDFSLDLVSVQVTYMP